MKTLPKKLSEKTIEIMNDFNVLKKSHDECQSKSRISEDFFDALSTPNDVDMKGEVKLSLDTQTSFLVSVVKP